MKAQQILIDALHKIACDDKIETYEQMISVASDALIEFMRISNIDVLPLTKNNKLIENNKLN